MACFLVPAAEAIVSTVATQIIKSKEKKAAADSSHAEVIIGESSKISFSTKLGWLNKLLWGGSALLAFEHVWHGEVVPFPPFLTAVENGEVTEMLAEMGTNGVLMAVIVTVVWGGMVFASSAIQKRALLANKQN